MVSEADRKQLDAEDDLGARVATGPDVYAVDRAAPQFSLVSAPTRLTSEKVLELAAKEVRERAAFYDAPAGERSMARTVAAFNAIHGASLTEVQGWQFMELLKMVRATQGKPREDNFVDGASYAALAGEAAMRSV